MNKPVKITPMMEQFIEIKAANPGSLLFYRMGDFYELFFEDAEIASRALGITLTKRGKHEGSEIPMCGVPYHAVAGYLQKLIKLGYRVSICDQMENPAEAKKRGAKSVVRRAVVRLVTSGTITEEGLLDPTKSNYLCALGISKTGEDETKMALAWVDISTGQFLTSPTTSASLSSDLARIEPSELLVSEHLVSDEKINEMLSDTGYEISHVSSRFFDSAAAEKTICSYFGVTEIDGLGHYTREEMTAASAILSYIDKTQIAEKPALSRPSSNAGSAVMQIDAATRQNLELVTTLSGERHGSLLHAIDRSVSSAGARLFAQRLKQPLFDKIQIELRQESVRFFVDHSQTLDPMRGILKKMPDIERSFSRLALNRGGPRDMRAIVLGLEAGKTITRQLEKIDNIPDELATAMLSLGNVSDALIRSLQNALSEELPLLVRDGSFVRDGYHDELDQNRRLRDESRKIIAGLQVKYAENSGIKSLKIRHNNMLGYFIEVNANNGENLLREQNKAIYIHRQTMANAMRFTTTELAELESKIANAAGRALEIELEIFGRLCDETRAAQTMISAAATALSVIDVAAANAKLAMQMDYCQPTISDDCSFDIEGARHPVVEQMLQAQMANRFIANDCNIGAKAGDENGSIWLLTGPNMGGKSTYLRQNALIVLMAQIGCFVPAKKASIGLVDKLFSRVGAADDLARGRSTFMVEMVETAAILNQATNKSLVILDEMGRGTATFDGLSIAWAAIEHLHEVNRCRTLFATHYHELVALCEIHDRLSPVTMKVKEWQGNVIFLHEVIKGAADRSYGIQVAKLAGLPQSVIERARDVLDQLENSERKTSSKKIIDDLPLFSVDQRSKPETNLTNSALIEALNDANPDELTPRQALEKLYQLRKISNSQKKN